MSFIFLDLTEAIDLTWLLVVGWPAACSLSWSSSSCCAAAVAKARPAMEMEYDDYKPVVIDNRSKLRFCPYCGAEVKVKTRFCPFCGERVNFN